MDFHQKKPEFLGFVTVARGHRYVRIIYVMYIILCICIYIYIAVDMCYVSICTYIAYN